MSSELILTITIILAGFYMAWNIGANDVANAVGTSVGSGALTIRNAIILAGILEFSGAFFFGSHVSETIQSGIIDPNFFAGNPKILVLGMLAALIGTGIWLQIASYLGWPVSTTHTIVGALVGFGLLIGGFETIYWKEVGFIISSWLLSPVLGGFLAYAIFSFLRNKIFYSQKPIKRAKKLIPYFASITIFLFSLMLLFHGIESQYLALSLGKAFWISLFLSAVVFALAKYFVSQVIKRTDSTSIEFSIIERMFGYLQIMTAGLMAFSHGANDVANAIGPLSASLNILSTGIINPQASVPHWALALGGFGIVIGLATWGYRVIETIGKKLTELTPTRGFAAEFGTSFTVLAASRLGLPISTTHTLVGAVIGVGLARGLEAVNLEMIREIFLSWLLTVPAGAISTISIFIILAWLFGI